MISYTFPQLIHDACVLAVAPVLSRALSGAMGDEMDLEEAGHTIKQILEDDPMKPSFQLLPGEEGPDLSGLGFHSLFFLLFHQPYTGFERDTSRNGAIIFLERHYDLTPAQEDMIWMTQHLYQTANDQLLAPDLETTDGDGTAGERAEGSEANSADFSTWTDERALDVMKNAIAPFGEEVEAFFAPLTTSLEVQTDMKRADAGNADAMVEVAYDLIEGRGVAPDFKLAQRWAEQALKEQTKRKDEAEKMLAFLELLNERY